MRGSTANIFDIPLSCHYGFGGPGFNAWRASPNAAEAAIAFVDTHLASTIDFMNAHGLTHFDTHFENIVTDWTRLHELIVSMLVVGTEQFIAGAVVGRLSRPVGPPIAGGLSVPTGIRGTLPCAIQTDLSSGIRDRGWCDGL